jgi:hypothetical protein
MVDYPFANRLYPNALDVLERFGAWGRGVTTVFPRQGHYAHDPEALATKAAATPASDPNTARAR